MKKKVDDNKDKFKIFGRFDIHWHDELIVQKKI